jgi:hypothetical protein
MVLRDTGGIHGSLSGIESPNVLVVGAIHRGISDFAPRPSRATRHILNVAPQQRHILDANAPPSKRCGQRRTRGRFSVRRARSTGCSSRTMHGQRITRRWFITACSTDWRIHHVA